jgi:hypothetical protein
MFAILLTLCCGVERLPVECRRVDVIELNHVVDAEDQGGRIVTRELVCQWIFWAWSPSRGRYCVVDWWRATGEHSLHGTTLVLQVKGRLYRIEAARVHETWGTDDPEVRAREQESLDWERPGLGW